MSAWLKRNSLRKAYNSERGSGTIWLFTFFSLVIAAGVFLQPKKLAFPPADSASYGLDAASAMLKVVSDLKQGKLTLDQEQAKTYQVGKYFVLIHRQADHAAKEAGVVRPYLIEVAGTNKVKDAEMIVQLQLTLFDFVQSPEDHRFQLGNFRYF